MRIQLDNIFSSIHRYGVNHPSSYCSINYVFLRNFFNNLNYIPSGCRCHYDSVDFYYTNDKDILTINFNNSTVEITDTREESESIIFDKTEKLIELYITKAIINFKYDFPNTELLLIN